MAEDTSARKPGSYLSLARLVNGDAAKTSHTSNATAFRWPGKAPNPAWENSVDASSLIAPGPGD